MQVKKQQDDNGGPDKNAPKLAPVGPNSLAWGGFMAVAGNARYQVVNCVEDRVLVSDLVMHAHTCDVMEHKELQYQQYSAKRSLVKLSAVNLTAQQTCTGGAAAQRS